MLKKGLSKYCKDKLIKEKAIACKGWLNEVKRHLETMLFNNYQSVVIDGEPCQKDRIYKDYYYNIKRMNRDYSCFK